MWQFPEQVMNFLEVISKLVVRTRQALPELGEVIGGQGLPVAYRLDPANWLAVALHDERLTAILDPVQISRLLFQKSYANMQPGGCLL